MELSTKKIQRAMDNFITKGNYQYYPSKYMFDYKSDPDYVYMAVESHYVIRMPREYAPQILSVKNTAIRTDINLERLIETTLSDKNITDYYMKELLVLDNGKPVVAFRNIDEDIILIDKKFFEQFYNHPITNCNVPANITFTGISGKNCYKSPLIMWEDDEAIALFLPIINRK